MTSVTAGSVVRRLLGAGLIRAADVVDREVVVRNTSRSNAVFLVASGGDALAVKAPWLVGREEQGSPDSESRLYASIAESPALGRAVPAPEVVGQLGDLLVLRRVEPGDTLEDRHRLRGPSRDDARLLGAALGAWRTVSPAFAGFDLPGRLPWVLDALEPSPPSAVSDSPGAARLAEALRGNVTLVEGLSRRRHEWRRTAVIHGDVRWDNAIVESSGGRMRVLLVDWEFLDDGDPGWDVAGALADAVAFEAVAEDVDTEEHLRPVTTEQLAALRGAVSPFVDTFAQAYRGAAPPTSAEADLEAGVWLLPARVLGIAFLHAAWGQEAGLGSALRLAGVAAALMEERT